MKPRCQKLELKSKDEWLAKRLRYITATDIGTILGKNVFDTREALIGDKLFGKSPIIDKRHVNRGIEAEGPIVKAAAKQFGFKYRHPLEFVVSTRYPWLACTPDAIARIDGETVLLEIKAPAKPWFKGIPESYIWQVKGQLMVTGLEKGLLVFAQYDEKTGRVSNMGTHEITLSKFEEKQIEVECYRVWKIIQDLRPVVEAVRFKHESV